MNILDMHIALMEKLDKSDALSVSNLEREHKDFWLNDAANRFKVSRYTGNSNRKTSFEKTQKRTDDLRTIVKRQAGGLIPFADEDDVYTFAVPSDYDFLASARFFVCEAVCGNDFIDTTDYIGTITDIIEDPNIPTEVPKEGVIDGGRDSNADPVIRIASSDIPNGVYYFGNKDGVFTGSKRSTAKVSDIVCRYVMGKEVQHDDLRKMLRDPFNKPRPDRPLYLFEEDQIYIWCSPDFILAWMEITYLKKLTPMSSVTPLPTGSVATSELPEHTHREIVNMAYSEILQTNGDPRYRTSHIELIKQE